MARTLIRTDVLDWLRANQWWTQFDSYEEAKAAYDKARKQRKQDDALPVQPTLFDDPAA